MNREKLRDIFVSVCDGFSADRVIADPFLNHRFLSECRSSGMQESDPVLNKGLLNLRKAGFFAGLPRSKRTSFSNEDEYRFAAEMSIRHIERRDGVSLDDVLCDPSLALEFDAFAQNLAPGYSSLQYRWAALNLRKSKSLQPELLGRVFETERVDSFEVEGLSLDLIPVQQGLYIFLHRENVLYVGESTNLRKRLGKHLEHSDNKGLAHWLWDRGSTGLFLEIHVLPKETTDKIRLGMEKELIQNRNPLFNVQR